MKRNLIEYLLPAMPDEELQIKTWLTFAAGQASAVRYSSITRVSDGEQLARRRISLAYGGSGFGETASPSAVDARSPGSPTSAMETKNSGEAVN